MSGNDLRLVIDHYRKKEHWECLNELAHSLREAADKIITIREVLKGKDIAQARQELPYELVRAFIYIEASKLKLSVMAPEWNEKMEETVKYLIDNEVDFEEVEF